MSAILTPRWFARAPREAEVAEFLREVSPCAVSYTEIGASNDPEARLLGYSVDHNRQRLGDGAGDFLAACEALQAWRMFPRPWTRIAPARPPQRTGEVVAMLAQAFGVWWLNACRVIYTLDERGPVRRFGFAYGTLPAHVEQGEERFSIEQHPDGSVWYDIRAFSRPRYWPVRLAKPLARRLQARFVAESKLAMRDAVAEVRRGEAA